jgi:hypothetical protein
VAAAAKNIPAEVEAAVTAGKVAQSVPKAAAAASPAIEAQLVTRLQGLAAKGQTPEILEKIAAEQVGPERARALVQALGGGEAKVANVAEDVAAAVKQAEVDKALAASRKAIGAERVGRTIGKTKEQVRMEAGPVLNEALGEASRLMPENKLKDVIDGMKKLPMAEREAYVARATSDKTMDQVETIRRALQHLGLLLPVGLAGAAASQEFE